MAGDKECPKTCDGTKPDFDPTDDPDYRSFKDMYTCVEDKCVIQLGSCNEDDICKQCCTYCIYTPIVFLEMNLNLVGRFD